MSNIQTSWQKYVRFKTHVTLEVINQLNLTFGDEAPSKTTVYRWLSEFNWARSSLSDKFREDRPQSTVVPENMDAVYKMIKLDRHVFYCEIEASLSISFTNIYAILHEHLTVRKLCSRWIPQNVTIAQKKAHVDWCKEILKKFNRGDWKDVYKMVTENRRTVNSDWYTTICLLEVFDEIRKTNKRRRIVHHYNAISQTKYYLSTQNIELMGHPPYSPDLAPNDFFLFSCVKNKLRGQRFSSPKEAIEAFKNHVLKIPHSKWNKCFENWFKRMQKCIDYRGEYFEKQ
ncbi:histone-lysine N-methyltransferase SETMAR-like [Rhynchophorus ferrugineus]|uniref:histone-lysine N-methyltransferase SETMAR-like n=1 Tax=Rhynchophorus ferrugineus TaxID=354439 RepID=UPI003FCD5DB1